MESDSVKLGMLLGGSVMGGTGGGGFSGLLLLSGDRSNIEPVCRVRLALDCG